MNTITQVDSIIPNFHSMRAIILNRHRMIELIHQMAMKLIRRFPVETTKTKKAITILSRMP